MYAFGGADTSNPCRKWKIMTVLFIILTVAFLVAFIVFLVLWLRERNGTSFKEIVSNIVSSN